MWSATGPFETEQEARAAATWQDVPVSMTDNERWREAWQAARRGRIQQVIDRTGVPVGAYDQRITQWVTNWEVEVVEVIAALVERAYEQGIHHAHADMREDASS